MNENTIRMLTIKQAGKIIPGLTEFRIRELCISGELPSVKAGKKYLINEQILYRYVNGEISNISNSNIKDKSCIKRINM